MTTTIEMVPKRRVLSFRQFVALSDAERKGLRSAKVTLPKLGRPGFGAIEVEGGVAVYHPKVKKASRKKRAAGGRRSR